MNDITIGSRIQAARLIQGYTTAQLCDMTGLSVEELTNFENNRWTPPMSVIVKLQRPLRCSMEWLLCSKDAEQPISPAEAELLVRFRELNKVEQRTIFDTVYILSEQKRIALESFCDTFDRNPY